ncbi:MAG: hypothetical protein VX840_13490 [Pseudomonadota bacterium]|nr:hypothetical protein [Pseudomonadota bacterium]
MITGTVYIELLDGVWQTVPAAFVQNDPSDSARVVVMVFPSPPSEPAVMVPVQLVSARYVAVPPISGELVYVPN